MSFPALCSRRISNLNVCIYNIVFILGNLASHSPNSKSSLLILQALPRELGYRYVSLFIAIQVKTLPSGRRRGYKASENSTTSKTQETKKLKAITMCKQ